MRFLRYGGLSPQKQVHGRWEDGEYYGPPRRSGIYAFPYPYMDLFYVVWCDRGKRELIHKGVRNFYYDGPVWCHLLSDREKDEEVEWIGAWREVTMEQYQKLLKRIFHEDIKELMGDPIFGLRMDKPEERAAIGNPMVYHPYKRGLGGAMSRDHLEIFLEGKYCARIR